MKRLSLQMFALALSVFTLNAHAMSEVEKVAGAYKGNVKSLGKNPECNLTVSIDKNGSGSLTFGSSAQKEWYSVDYANSEFEKAAKDGSKEVSFVRETGDINIEKKVEVIVYLNDKREIVKIWGKETNRAIAGLLPLPGSTMTCQDLVRQKK